MTSNIDTTSGQDLSQNKQSSLRAINISVVILATSFVALRFFARWKAGVRWGMDDFTLLGALLILFSLMGISLQMIHYGLGVHQAALEFDAVVNVLKLLLAFECVYVTTIAAIKISLLLMYRRAFDIKSLRIQTYVLGGVVVAWAISICCVCIFQCDPIAKAWNPLLDGRCINLKGSFIGNAVPNIITDILMLALPVRHVWKLVPSMALRLQLSCVFLLGSFVVAASIYRFTTLFAFHTSDVTWTLAKACDWCIIECAVGVISVCLPTLGPLLQFASCITLPSQRSHTNTRSLGSKQSKYSSHATTTGTNDLTYGKALGDDALIPTRTRSFERLSSCPSMDNDERRDVEMGNLQCIIHEIPTDCDLEHEKWFESGHVTFTGLMPRDMSGRKVKGSCVTCEK